MSGFPIHTHNQVLGFLSANEQLADLPCTINRYEHSLASVPQGAAQPDLLQMEPAKENPWEESCSMAAPRPPWTQTQGEGTGLRSH